MKSNSAPAPQEAGEGELRQAAGWALRTLESLARQEAERLNSTFELCDYNAAKALRQSLSQAPAPQEAGSEFYDERNVDPELFAELVSRITAALLARIQQLEKRIEQLEKTPRAPQEKQETS